MSALSAKNRFFKRSFDLVVALVGLLLTLPLQVVLLVACSIDTASWGLLSQTRIGNAARPFQLLKFKTMKNSPSNNNSITTANDPRITVFGRFLRRTKLDELPQFWNVLSGSMSIVGPRPDVPGYADRLTGDDRIILSMRPGITGPATLAFRHEEQLLAEQSDPQKYNDEVLWPKKVAINKAYVLNYNPMEDVKILLRTLGLGVSF